MSQANPFRHQEYHSTRPSSPHHLLSPPPGPRVGSDGFQRRMQRVGEIFRQAGVARIYLAHGTFAGDDAQGILAGLGRVLPTASRAARRVIRRVVDAVSGEAGNYTRGYARCFEAALRVPGTPRIPVRLFRWSSENHHLGRADGAVRLIDELKSLRLRRGQRVLLWGHSHAGNVFALVTNLLAGDRKAVEQFFEAAAIYYRWPLVGCVDIPVWKRVHALLRHNVLPLRGVALDIATFGTPIRYGWDSSGYGDLLHFVNHRPAEDLPPYLAPFPPKLQNVLRGADRDYVQQLGIAGTNVTPSILAWRARVADMRLQRLLQDEPSSCTASQRFEAGAIVPDEGTTLLVDYGAPSCDIGRPLAGHAVYTRKKWLLFHAEEVARRFYDKVRAA
jgi:hypothetical protein